MKVIVAPINEMPRQYPSVEELPPWIQERYAVLRLLEMNEPNPLGLWSVSTGKLFLYIVRQPGDPEWRK